jgi:hypothetical protein
MALNMLSGFRNVNTFQVNIIPSQTGFILNNIYNSVRTSQETLRPRSKTNRLMLFREANTVYSEYYIEQVVYTEPWNITQPSA